jgi:hypothetical protein
MIRFIIIIVLNIYSNEAYKSSKNPLKIKQILASSNFYNANETYISWYNLSKNIFEQKKDSIEDIEQQQKSICAQTQFEKAPWVIIDTGVENNFIKTIRLHQNLKIPLHDFDIQIGNNSCMMSSNFNSICHIQMDSIGLNIIEIECNEFGRYVIIRVLKHKKAVISLCKLEIFGIYYENNEKKDVTCAEWSGWSNWGMMNIFGNKFKRYRVNYCSNGYGHCGIDCIDHNWNGICEGMNKNEIENENKCLLDVYKDQCERSCEICHFGETGEKLVQYRSV